MRTANSLFNTLSKRLLVRHDAYMPIPYPIPVAETPRRRRGHRRPPVDSFLSLLMKTIKKNFGQFLSALIKKKLKIYHNFQTVFRAAVRSLMRLFSSY